MLVQRGSGGLNRAGATDMRLRTHLMNSISAIILVMIVLLIVAGIAVIIMG